MFLSIIIFIITLLILVMIHELGHFAMCKKFGIKVLEFGFGLPPKIWSKRYGETEYSINALPIGGFVRPLGEDEVSKKLLENPRSFAAQKVSRRIIVVAAGVFMNLIFAWILFYIVLGFGGFKSQLELIADHRFVGVEQSKETFVYIAQVAKDSPAQSSGLKMGDRILALNGKSLASDQDLITETKAREGQKITLTVGQSENNSKLIEITPRINPPAGQGPLGVALAGYGMVTLQYKSLPQKIFAGPIHSWNIISYSGDILGRLINQSLAQKSFRPVSQTVAGPVGITSLANSVLTSTSAPLLPYLYFVGLISLNLAVMNLLPIPALDGGRLFFLLVEALTRRRVHAEFEKWVHTIGFAALLALTLLITYSDLRKIFF